MNNDTIIRLIVNCCGGIDNIETISCCITRLRLQLKNNILFDSVQAESIPGVSGVIFRNGQPQIILGLEAGTVFAEIKKAKLFSDKIQDL